MAKWLLTCWMPLPASGHIHPVRCLYIRCLMFTLRMLHLIAALHLLYALSFLMLAIANPLRMEVPAWMLLIQSVLPAFFYTYRNLARKLPPTEPINTGAEKQWVTHKTQIAYLLSLVLLAAAGMMDGVFFRVQSALFLRYVVCLVPAVVLCALYYPNFLFKKGLRGMGYAKPFVLGFTWAYAACLPVLSLLPASGQGSHVYVPVLLNLFLLFSALGMLSDGKDALQDAKNGIITLSVEPGWQISNRYVALPLLLVSACADFYLFGHSPIWQRSIGCFFFALFAFWICRKTHPEASALHHHYGVDGLMLIKAICWLFLCQ